MPHTLADDLLEEECIDGGFRVVVRVAEYVPQGSRIDGV